MRGRQALSKDAPRAPSILSASHEFDAVKVAAAEIATIRNRSSASSALARWITEAFRPSTVDVRVVVPDRNGRLRLAAKRSHTSETFSAERVALRKAAFSSKRPLRGELPDGDASTICIPLVAAGEAHGVLEVAARPGEIETRWAILDCLASLGAVALHGVRRRETSGATRKVVEAPSSPGAAWMAHEIRSPLLVARATVERVMMSELEDHNKRLLERSRQHLDELTETVDRILDWACGGLSAGRRTLDFSAVVRSAIAAASAEGGADRLHVTTPERLTVLGDEPRITIAITNLIRNALRYSPEGSSVSVVLERSGNWASLRVDDEGPGVAEDERELIFAPLVRGRAGQGDGSGRGLGLFMARQAVEELGGRIWVESNGGGSSFRTLIPTAPRGERSSGS